MKTGDNMRGARQGGLTVKSLQEEAVARGAAKALSTSAVNCNVFITAGDIARAEKASKSINLSPPTAN